MSRLHQSGAGWRGIIHTEVFSQRKGPSAFGVTDLEQKALLKPTGKEGQERGGDRWGVFLGSRARGGRIVVLGPGPDIARRPQAIINYLLVLERVATSQGSAQRLFRSVP